MDFFHKLTSWCNGAAPEVEVQPEVELPENLKQIRKQMEFYFSDSNLEGDSFMKNTINEREDRYVEASVFLRFKRIQNLNATEDDILTACAASKTLEVDREHKLIRSKKPFVADPRRAYRTVSLRGFDKTETLDSLNEFFAEKVGDVKKITMRKGNQKGSGEKFFTGIVEVELGTEELAQELVKNGLTYNGKDLSPILVTDLKKKISNDKRKQQPRK